MNCLVQKFKLLHLYLAFNSDLNKLLAISCRWNYWEHMIFLMVRGEKKKKNTKSTWLFFTKT